MQRFSQIVQMTALISWHGGGAVIGAVRVMTCGRDDAVLLQRCCLGQSGEELLCRGHITRAVSMAFNFACWMSSGRNLAKRSLALPLNHSFVMTVTPYVAAGHV